MTLITDLFIINHQLKIHDHYNPTWLQSIELHFEECSVELIPKECMKMVTKPPHTVLFESCNKKKFLFLRDIDAISASRWVLIPACSSGLFK